MSSISELDAVTEFVAAMTRAGCPPAIDSQIVADDQLRRFQVAGDPPHRRNGCFRLAVNADGFAIGWFRDWKSGVHGNYCSKVPGQVSGLSGSERANLRKKVRAAKKADEEARYARAAEVAKKSQGMWANSATTVDGHPYFLKKGLSLSPAEIGLRQIYGKLAVPGRVDGGRGDIQSLQLIAGDGSKIFLKGGAVLGCGFLIPGSDGLEGRLALCEGLSTGVSIRESTDWSVLVTFFAANLLELAEKCDWLRNLPRERVVICADNDHHLPPAKPNSGEVYARKAAKALGGVAVLLPPAEDGISDWNDVALRYGRDSLKERLAWAQNATNWLSGVGIDVGEGLSGDLIDRIGPLGYDRGNYWFHSAVTDQVVCYPASALGRLQTISDLANVGELRSLIGGSVSNLCTVASVALMQACQRKGIYDPDVVRGVGVWKDKVDGVPVYLYHQGHSVVLDGAVVSPREVSGDYRYEKVKRPCPIGAEISGSVAAQIHEACTLLPWRDDRFGDLLAGWLVAAVLGGALKWRPHVLLTGPRGSGKSTALRDVVAPCLGKFALLFDGGTTEAGVRRKLGNSSRPAIMDEFEAESEAARRQTEAVLRLVRGSSSGSHIENADAQFSMRSCFFLSGINSPVRSGADQERITPLEMRIDGNEERYSKFKSAAYRLSSTSGLAGGFIHRVFGCVDKLLAAIDRMEDALAAVADSRREADQLAPMVVGAWWLRTGQFPSPDQCSEEAARWRDISGRYNLSDAERLVEHVLSFRCRFRREDLTLGQILVVASGGVGESEIAASALAGSYGLKIWQGKLAISNRCPALREVLAGTPWQDEWRRVLKDFPGAETSGQSNIYFAPGVRTKATLLPADLLSDDEETVDARKTD